MTTTFRADLVEAMVASLDEFIATNPARLRRSESTRPPSVLGDLPLAFIDRGSEAVAFDMQTMDRVMTISVVVVSAIADNAETVIGHDQTVDLLIDHFNANSIHFVENSVWSDLAIADEDYPVASDDGSVRHFYATRFTFVVSKMEGRA